MSLIDPVESLVFFAKDIKPFHSKIMDIIIEYIHSDNINVVMTEQLEWLQRNGDEIEPGIHLNFDRATVCDEGFGMSAMGTIHPNQEQLAENPDYDPLDVNYRPELDRNQPEYEPSELAGASPTEIQVSTPFLPYLETIRESYWNNANCPVPSECMIIPMLSESQSTNLTVSNAFCNNFHQTYDSINAFNFEFGDFGDCRYPFRLSQVVQNDYPGSPATYGVAKAHFHMDRSKWYWEIRIDSYTSAPEDIRVGILEFDPLTIEPPFGITNNTTPLGDLPDHVGLAGNGDLYVGGVLSAGYSVGYAAGDVVGVAFDVDSNTIQFYINGVAAGALINNAVDITNLRGIFPVDESSPPWVEDENASPPLDYKVYAPGVSMILDNTQTAVTILAELDNIQYSVPVGFSLLEAGEICEGYIALPAPVLTEVTPIPAYSFVHTPQYVFNSDQAGSIEYVGGGVGDLTEVVVGDNTITYNYLIPDYYDDFSIIVTSYENCRSTTLNLSAFEVAQPLLDEFPTGAVLGVSLRQLKTSATLCLQVRKTVLGVDYYEDIGFVDGIIDIDALETFCAGTNGYVSIWYNQVTNGTPGTNVIQPDTNRQPKIVTSGVIEKRANNTRMQITFVPPGGNNAKSNFFFVEQPDILQNKPYNRMYAVYYRPEVGGSHTSASGAKHFHARTNTNKTVLDVFQGSRISSKRDIYSVCNTGYQSGMSWITLTSGLWGVASNAASANVERTEFGNSNGLLNFVYNWNDSTNGIGSVGGYYNHSRAHTFSTDPTLRRQDGTAVNFNRNSINEPIGYFTIGAYWNGATTANVSTWFFEHGYQEIVIYDDPTHFTDNADIEDSMYQFFSQV